MGMSLTGHAGIIFSIVLFNVLTVGFFTKPCVVYIMYIHEELAHGVDGFLAKFLCQV